MNPRLPKLCFVLLAVYVAFHFSGYYVQLPDVVESHFGSRGNPNGWQSKPVFFRFFIGIIVLSTFFSFGLPALLRALPVELFNLPNKKYWFARERREATFDFLGSWFAWLGCGVLLFASYVFQFAIDANLHPGHVAHPERLLYAIVTFVLFTLLWAVRMFLRFPLRPPVP